MSISNYLSIKPEFRANLCAQGLTFILNVSGYILTKNFMFIWAEFASLCFLGTNTARSNTFFDRNIFNHFLIVMIYYFLSLLIRDHGLPYLFLIFIFTYCFYILKDNGYTKSINLWTYIQALLIGTTLISYPFEDKIIASIVGYFEAQILLNFSFLFFKNSQNHYLEPKFSQMLQIPLKKWLSIGEAPVRLAIRGSLTAVILYYICASRHDIRPNWAVVTAISALLRDDKAASLRVIKGVSIGSLAGWPIAILMIYLVGNNHELATILVWLSLILALALSFELMTNPNLGKQIISSMIFLFSVVSVSLAMGSYDRYTYLHLKVANSLIGEAVALIVLAIWEQSKKIAS